MYIHSRTSCHCPETVDGNGTCYIAVSLGHMMRSSHEDSKPNFRMTAYSTILIKSVSPWQLKDSFGTPVTHGRHGIRNISGEWHAHNSSTACDCSFSQIFWSCMAQAWLFTSRAVRISLVPSMLSELHTPPPCKQEVAVTMHDHEYIKDSSQTMREPVCHSDCS